MEITTNAAWKPSLTYHAVFVGVLMGLCAAAFIAICYATAHFPPPYQIHRPAPQATPWQNAK